MSLITVDYGTVTGGGSKRSPMFYAKSSSVWSAQWYIDFAMNNDGSTTMSTSSAWIAQSNNVGEWVKFTFDDETEGEKVNKISFYTKAVSGSWTINFRIQGSNVDSTWTDVSSKTVIATNTQTKSEYSFDNSTAYKYYRIYFDSAIQASGSNYVMFAGFKLYY